MSTYMQMKTLVVFADGLPPPNEGEFFMVIEYHHNTNVYMVQSLSGTLRKYRAKAEELRPFWLQRGDKLQKINGDKKQILGFKGDYGILEVIYDTIAVKPQQSRVDVKWLETKFEKFI